MKRNQHLRMFAVILVAAYLLSACGGTLPGNINTNDAVSTVIAIASSTPALPVASTTPQAGGAAEVEIFGIVESMTEKTVTINGVTYNIVADLTEFKDVISVGDQVKIHVLVNADGTFTIREIEMSTGDDNVNNNDNANVNSNDDNGNDSNSNDENSNDANSNDDNGNDNNDSSGSGSSENGNDDNGGNDNGGNDNG